MMVLEVMVLEKETCNTQKPRRRPQGVKQHWSSRFLWYAPRGKLSEKCE